MINSELRKRATSAGWISTACLFTLAILFATPQTAHGQWTTNGSNINNTNSGNVGVGTSSPTAKLHVVGANGANDNTIAPAPDALKVSGGTGGNGNWGGSPGGIGGAINFTGGTGGAPASGSQAAIGGKGGSISFTGGTGGPNTFGVGGGKGGDIVLNGGIGVVNSAGNVVLADLRGNVGIGTAAPSAKLHVVGDVAVTGNISAKYQDVAEWVSASQKLGPGTVVVLDAERGSDVVASSQAYDTKVAGVISTRPGLALGESGEDKVLVATTGRVRVKVDATRASIRVGDLLVTSNTTGYAMKSKPIVINGRSMHMPGTLIGKALEPLEKGTGEIMVLLSLQ